MRARRHRPGQVAVVLVLGVVVLVSGFSGIRSVRFPPLHRMDIDTMYLQEEVHSPRPHVTYRKFSSLLGKKGYFTTGQEVSAVQTMQVKGEEASEGGNDQETRGLSGTFSRERKYDRAAGPWTVGYIVRSDSAGMNTV